MPNVLANLFSWADGVKRRVSSPLQTIALGLQRGSEDLAAAGQDMDTAYGRNGMNSVLITAQQRAEAAQRAADFGANMGIAGIVSPGAAMNLNIAKKLPSDENFLAAVANTPGAQLSDDGLRMAVQRNQMPDQAMRPSVRGGVFYLPQGAAQAKHYSTGKNGYGGGERISGETLIANPLVAKGGTGGKAPASAYDQLMGKGAYEAMRTEAIATYGFGGNQSNRTQLVRAFLEKHAPELADQAEYIVRNSSQGNQLAYALQEAAVGSRVRAAGHDSVLGYSKGKQGPFLSEIFDVRESHYPDKFGGSKVWEGLHK